MTTRRSFDEGNARQGVPDSFLRSDPLFGEGYRLGAEELKPVERKGEAMTSEDELKAAAERWGRKCVRSTTYPEEETMYEIPRQRLLDAERLADWAVARLAADKQREREDAEPITKQRLWDMGALEGDVRGSFEHEMCFEIGGDDGILACIGRTGSNVPYFARITCSDEYGVLLPGPLKKMGQLRKLLEALAGGDT